MVNLLIRLNSKGGSTSAAGTPSASGSTPGGITAAGGTNSATPRLVCGPHLTLSDLPVASGVALVPSVHSDSTAITGLGFRVRRQPGNKVHFCVRCNFPIAIYGRLDPCEHVFCLICSKKEINCYLCEEKVLRIQKIELLEGICVCGAAGCLRSFLSKLEFEWHVKDAHLDILPSKEVLSPKPIDVLQSQQSLGQRDHSSSHSQHSQPPSPLSNTWRQESATFPASSPGPEKQGKPHVLGPSRDHSEPPPKRKKSEAQPSATVREKEKDKERDNQKQGHRDREHGQRDREQSMKEREPLQRDRDRDRERDTERDRERELQTQSHRDRDRESWEQQQQRQHVQQQHPQQGTAHYPLPPPPPPPLPPPPFQSNKQQPGRLAQAPINQQGGGTPGPYSPQQPFPPFHPQQQDTRNAARYDSVRRTPFLDPRMAVPPDYQENNGRGRHPQQEGERARSIPHQQQEGYGLVMDRQGLMVPHFHGEFGAPPMGMMIGHQGMQGMNRFQDGGHGAGHLPPPSKRGNFGPGGESGMGHPQHMFGWGGPANFGPGHPQFMNWQPPQ